MLSQDWYVQFASQGQSDPLTLVCSGSQGWLVLSVHCHVMSLTECAWHFWRVVASVPTIARERVGSRHRLGCFQWRWNAVHHPDGKTSKSTHEARECTGHHTCGEDRFSSQRTWTPPVFPLSCKYISRRQCHTLTRNEGGLFFVHCLFPIYLWLKKYDHS